MAQTYAESRESRLACKALYTQCPPGWVMAQMYAEAEKTDCVAGLYLMPIWVGNGADARREQ